MSAETLYGWCDVETDGTGRDANLIEIAFLLTDTDLNLLDEEGYHAVIRYTSEERDALYAGADDFVKEMHTTSGLWDLLDSPTAKPMDVVDDELSAYIKSFAPERRQVLMGGNSLRLDMNMVEWYLPKTYAHLHYRSVDVSAVAEVTKQWYDLECPPKELKHEAMADIRETITQARFLRENMSVKKDA